MSDPARNKSPVVHRRVLLKIGGEWLAGPGDRGVDVAAAGRAADRIVRLATLGVEIGVVVGGGNLVRGGKLAGGALRRTTADAMGMLATVINALVLAEGLGARGHETRVLSAFEVGGFAERFSAAAARRHLEAGRIVFAAGGLGNPLFTTDTCAAVRAVELGAALLVKATNVDGVYAADPAVEPDAERFTSLTYGAVIDRRLGVMDITAVTLCMENDLPVVVLNFAQDGALEAVVRGDRSVGTWIGS
ncbi:MAG: UMP kinase [Planctomycetes bacterium]|nr:UMP kinase [Planctomycetota bacterium]